MSLLDQLDKPEVWQGFLAYKQLKGHLSRGDEAALEELIATRGYLDLAHALQAGEALPPPEKIRINKLGAKRKRVVYAFDAQLMWVLKLMAWLLLRFDERQPAGCYSFRRDHGVHRALGTIIRTPGINGMWCCKLDISDYFNSIQVPLLLPIVRDVLGDDPPLVAFFEQLLCAGVALDEGILINEEHGVMAGMPTAPFLANLYLCQLDAWFTQRGYTYARYSDDIIFFSPDEAGLLGCRDRAQGIIVQHGLTINQDKACISAPGESWEFLGISYCNGTIDLSTVTMRKIKGKIRRKARALRRWMLRKQKEASLQAGEGQAAENLGCSLGDKAPTLVQRAVRAYIRSFNNKFFESLGGNELTWARWFFPLLTTNEGLHEVDLYLQQYARWIPTGRFTASNYQTSYADLKALGLRSLVHEYHAYQKEREQGKGTR